MGAALIPFSLATIVYLSLHYVLQRHLVSRLFQWRGSESINLSSVDISSITNKLLSALHAVVITVAGFYIMWETASDCLYSRSEVVTQVTYVCVSYMICDTISLYYTDCKTVNIPFKSRRSVLAFIKKRPLFVLHHVTVVIGHPLLAYHSFRKGMGDFLIGTLFFREMSSPFLATAKIMKRMKLQGLLLYMVNGAVLICIFFLVRVANTPLTFLYYSAQHHNWDMYSALSAMRLVCHLFPAAELALQSFWFYKILAVACRTKLKQS